jgi:hypothetical protein
MDVSQLSREQAKKILAAVEPMMQYTERLTRRMQAVRWKTTDPIYVHAHRAHDALHALRILTHYAACGLSEAGKSSEPPKG